MVGNVLVAIPLFGRAVLSYISMIMLIARLIELIADDQFNLVRTTFIDSSVSCTSYAEHGGIALRQRAK